ncbi:MAG: dCTP deaminase [Azovibrio sp.]|uniref:dCTP deaminase n=1 Tax=Azovibrio sp. TaxID=1872673 RepID=UPI003C70DD16
MSLLSYYELCQLVEDGVITDVDPKAINAASIDVRLGNEIVVEDVNVAATVVSIREREVFPAVKLTMPEQGYILSPGEFILAHTVEKFNLPNDIVAEFKLKSSGARTGLENALATWCDCGWNGSVLTLELKNFLRRHSLRITPGMYIGQMIFYRVSEVPAERSYATIGRYNNDASVQTVKE